MTTSPWHLSCLVCSATYGTSAIRYRCDCGGVLEIVHDVPSPETRPTLAQLDERLGSKKAIDRSGVWRFREWVLPVADEDIQTRPEGGTPVYRRESISSFCGVDDLCFKHEGENPTGSFKDRGMTTGVTMARVHGMKSVACASTGNTSASMAAYAAQCGMRALVFIPDGQIAFGKLAQALAYGATTLQIAGDFDDAMRIVEEIALERDIYLLNSINPYRLEGQKSIGFELLQDLDWQMPDWIVTPGGNLGNSSAIHKGLREWKAAGLIDRMPRFAVIQAAGANPLYRAFSAGLRDIAPVIGATTIATAIRIGAPVSGPKAMRAIIETDGVVEEVTDEEILEAKAVIDASGVGAEPASCATAAGIKKLRAAGVIAPGDRVAAVLTGNVLKDPGVIADFHEGRMHESTRRNPPRRIAATREAVLRALDEG